MVGPPISRSAHNLTLDGRIRCFHRFEATNRLDQLLQLAMIGPDTIVEILHLVENRALRTRLPSSI